MSRGLPRDLYAAYDWVAYAGELGELQACSSEQASEYAVAASANAAENGYDISAVDFVDLYAWIVEWRAA